MIANIRMAKNRRSPIWRRGTMAFMIDFRTTCRPNGQDIWQQTFSAEGSHMDSIIKVPIVTVHRVFIKKFTKKCYFYSVFLTFTFTLLLLKDQDTYLEFLTPAWAVEARAQLWVSANQSLPPLWQESCWIKNNRWRTCKKRNPFFKKINNNLPTTKDLRFCFGGYLWVYYKYALLGNKIIKSTGIRAEPPIACKHTVILKARQTQRRPEDILIECPCSGVYIIKYLPM